MGTADKTTKTCSEVYNLKVFGIVKNNEGQTAGAKFRNLDTGETIDINTSVIKKHRDIIKCTNAIVDKNGFVKSSSKDAKLSIFNMVDAQNYRINTDIEKHLCRIDMDDKIINKRCNMARTFCMRLSREFNDSAEVLVLINIRTGEFGFEYGDYRHVNIGAGTIDIIKESGFGDVIAIHNHPDNSIISHKDIAVMSRYKEIYRIEAIGNCGDILSVTKTEKFEAGEANKLARVIEELAVGKVTKSEYNKTIQKLKGMKYHRYLAI